MKKYIIRELEEQCFSACMSLFNERKKEKGFVRDSNIRYFRQRMNYLKRSMLTLGHRWEGIVWENIEIMSKIHKKIYRIRGKL